MFSLEARPPGQDERGWFGHYLLRELPRQAVLLAAREGLGAATRDRTLREPLAEFVPPEGLRLDIATLAGPEMKATAELRKPGAAAEDAPLWKLAYQLPTADDVFYTGFVTELEAKSRGELVEALGAAGLAPTATTPGDKADMADVESRLAELRLTSQFAALRQAHRALRAVPDSAEALGAVARGYAHLGQLTSFHWNAAYAAFQARALLYAERLVAKAPDSPLAHWTRAYVRAWTGLHAAALAELAEAERLASAGSAQGARPGWVGLIEPLCRYDHAALGRLAETQPELAPLGRFLAFVCLERASGDKTVLEAAQRVLAAAPDCYRVHDSLCELESLSILHQATLSGAMALEQSLGQRVAELPRIPKAVKSAALGQGGAGLFGRMFGGGPGQPFSPRAVRIAKPLVSAAEEDRDEPSWAVLGRLIEETNFAQVAQRLDFLRHNLGVPVADFTPLVLPGIEGHPYRAWVESCAVNSSTDPKRFAELGAKVEIFDPRLNMVTMLRDFWRLTGPEDKSKPPNAPWNWEYAKRNASHTAYDLEPRLRWLDQDEKRTAARELLVLSPYSPVAVATLIELDSQVGEAQRKEWEERYAWSSSVLARLVNRSLAAKQTDDARALLEKLIRLEPNQWAHETLARLYFEDKQDEKGIETLKAYLEQPDYGLGHASVRVKLAEYYMAKQQYELAEPYAAEAAETWAAWAMLCASRCYEALGKLDESGLWMQRNAERYEGERAQWYLWCRRNGQGDEAAAFDLARQHVDELEAGKPPRDQGLCGVFYLLSRDRPRARECFARVFEQEKTAWAGLHLAFLADEQGDKQTRDRVLGVLAARRQPIPAQGDWSVEGRRTELAALVYEAYKQGGEPPELSPAAVARLLANANADSTADLEYFLGVYADRRGAGEEAVEHWQRSFRSGAGYRFNCTLAAAELWDRGFTRSEVLEQKAGATQ